MAYSIVYSQSAERQLRKLDRPVAARILAFMERVKALSNPRSTGEALHGDTLGMFWKYRVGDWRLVVSIKDSVLPIEVIEIDHRSKVYRERPPGMPASIHANRSQRIYRGLTTVVLNEVCARSIVIKR